MFRRHLIAGAIFCTLASATWGQALPAGIETQKDITFATIDGKPLKMDWYSKLCNSPMMRARRPQMT